MRKTWVRTVGVLAVTLGASSLAIAADHTDGTTLQIGAADAAADITDVYSWMSADKANLNLVMNVYPNAVAGAQFSQFSNTVKYVFHTAWKSSLVPPAPAADTATVTCTFDNATPQNISCWVLDKTGAAIDYVTGPVEVTAGNTSASGKLKVFAGLRDDPFFFNLAGFKKTTRAVARATQTAGQVIGQDASMCPILSPLFTMQLIQSLAGDCVSNLPAYDFFAKTNPAHNADCAANPGSANQALTGDVLSIVVQVDAGLVTTMTKKIVSVWAGTYR